MRTLHELTEAEQAIWETVDAIRAVSPSPELRDMLLARERVYARAESVFADYVLLACESPRETQRREAVRRAIFLSWWASVAPPTTTGLAELSATAVTEVLWATEELVLRADPDAELAWMLPWYYWHTPAWLTLYSGRAALIRYCHAQPMDVWIERTVRPRRMHRRGAMGRYWQVILASAA